jgi:lysophospholipase L1-like esterase/pimeloyl-ACP methyl ester carboxylesterase
MTLLVLPGHLAAGKRRGPGYARDMKSTFRGPRWHGVAGRLSFLLLLAVAIARGQAAEPLRGRVVFLGDSITYAGQYVEFVEAGLRLTAPKQDFEVLNLGLPSETVSGLSEVGHAGGAFPRPDLNERLDRVLQKLSPKVVVACYGMNDGIYYPFAEERFERFKQGMRRLHDRAIATGARIIHVTPSPFDASPIRDRTLPAGRSEYPQPYEGYDEVLGRYSEWLLFQRAQGWEVVDAHAPMVRFLALRRKTDPNYTFARDGVHPDTTGHWLIARELLVVLGAPVSFGQLDSPGEMLAKYPNGESVLQLVRQRQALLKDAWLTEVGHQRPGMARGLPLAQARTEAAELEHKRYGTPSEWNGFARYDFPIGDKAATVICPRRPLPGAPWAWKGEFLDAFPAVEIALLNKGLHIFYLAVPDLLGSPTAVQHWNTAYREVTTTFRLAPKVALIGLSRGGLYCYNWAVANPGRVACIYGDAPVCDFKSWPGGRGKGKGSPRDWQLVLDCYNFKTEAEALAYTRNPVDNLAPLAQAGVPLLHVYGDADDVVPWDENTGKLAERYRILGGDITLIAKPGVGHHPHGLPDPTPIVDFIVRHASASQAP